MAKIYTIGYEGSDIERLVETLLILEIDIVADVRELPISRKKGFSKNRLKDALAARSIGYRHFKDLGDPKSGREAARAGRMEEFRSIFSSHFSSREAQESFEDLIKLARKQRTCMLCFERSANNCHRSIIADAAVMRGVEVFNLVADQPEKYIGNETSIPRYHPRESLAAAE